MFPVQKTEEEENDFESRLATEYERLLSYEEEMFRKLGMNEWQAAALAERHVSWHDADDLLKAGCALETAVDLLL